MGVVSNVKKGRHTHNQAVIVNRTPVYYERRHNALKKHGIFFLLKMIIFCQNGKIVFPY